MKYLHLESFGEQENLALLREIGIQGFIVSRPLDVVGKARSAGFEIRWAVPDLWRLGRIANQSRLQLLKELVAQSHLKSWVQICKHILTALPSPLRKNFVLPIEALGRLQTSAEKGEWVYLDAHATDTLLGFGNLLGLRHFVKTFQGWGFRAGFATGNLRTLTPMLLNEGWLPDGILTLVDPYRPMNDSHEDLEWGKVLGVEILWDLSQVHESWPLYSQWATLPKIVAQPEQGVSLV